MKISLHHLALCAATLGASSAAFAQPAAPASVPAPVCEAHVQGQPGKKFDLTELRVSKRCVQFTVHLLHTGKKPWQEAGHNWVLTRSKDTEAVIREGQRSGPERAWLSRGDARVLAATQMLSGGEHASVSFPVERLSQGEDYTYFCSFPTHAEPMRGKLVVID
ncbi:azurin [Comamonas sp.]|uniref:azurin n=1 Tax=Comamonas sp. TaxID=34028 RepID=UPI00289B930A|nr:azurin [Comamonas sp.]